MNEYLFYRLDRSTKEILMTYDTETVDVELTVTLIEYIATHKPVCVLHCQHFFDKMEVILVSVTL